MRSSSSISSISEPPSRLASAGIASTAMDVSHSSDESKVLIINTGGTINMIFSQQGYVPEPYFLTETLHSQHRFHDPLEESLFSHSSSLEGYRRWSSNSGKNSPTGTTFGSREPSPSRGGARSYSHQALTLPVRSCRPIGLPEHLAPQMDRVISRQPVCRKVIEDIYEAQLPTLVTPRSSGPGGSSKRIRYAVLEVRSKFTMHTDAADVNTSGILCSTVVTLRFKVHAQPKHQHVSCF